VNARASATTSVVQVTLGAAPPYQVDRVCASATSPALVNPSPNAGASGVCLVAPASTQCVGAGACVTLDACGAADYAAGYCLRTIAVMLTRCATCGVDAQINIAGIQLGCAEPYSGAGAPACTAGYNTSTALLVQTGPLGPGAVSQVADASARVAYMRAGRAIARAPGAGAGQAAFMWGDAVYFTMGLDGLRVQSAYVKALLTAVGGAPYASVNNTGYLAPQYLAANGMGWDAATQTMVFAYPVDEGLATGLTKGVLTVVVYSHSTTRPRVGVGVGVCT
jgi:hypothetical protein